MGELVLAVLLFCLAMWPADTAVWLQEFATEHTFWVWLLLVLALLGGGDEARVRINVSDNRRRGRDRCDMS